MKSHTQKKFGMNRTGKDASPILSKMMLSETEELTKPRCPSGSSADIAQNRIEVMKEVEGLGSIPVPATFKGIIKTGLEILERNHPEILIDKLGERLAFERTGVRIYDALISKFNADAKNLSSIASLERLQEIRDEEYQHFSLLRETILDLGADPTAMTPSADLAAVTSTGIVKVLGDPRINFIQSLEAILVAELCDNDCWKNLFELTSRAGLREVSLQFETCYQEEQEHLVTIREWVSQFSLGTRAEAKKDVA